MNRWICPSNTASTFGIIPKRLFQSHYAFLVPALIFPERVIPFPKQQSKYPLQSTPSFRIDVRRRFFSRMNSIFSNLYYRSETMSEINDLVNAFSAANVEQNKEEILSFEGRGLKLESEEDAAEVASEIEKANIVHGIVFKGNTVGTGAAKRIGKALATKQEFKRALWSDMFTGRLKAEIPSALLDLCGGIQAAGAHLVELDLSDNAFGPNGAKGIENFLRSPSAYSLEILKLNNNGLGIQGGRMIASALKDCHKLSTDAGRPLKLRVFVGGRNRLENDGATALAECFKLIGTLEEVTMPQNGIYHVGVTALADAFAHNPGMRIINLSDNTLTKKGATAIANVLNAMEKLEVINFDDCLLKSKGGLVLADSLKNSCKNLKELHLNGNEFDPSVGLAIVASMSNKRSLKLLDMNSNAFGEEGIQNITLKAEELNLRGALGSFEDDEDVQETEEEGSVGSEERDQDDDDEPESTEGEVETAERVTAGTTSGYGTQNGSSFSPPKSKGSLNPAVEKFYLNPDATTLIELDEIIPEQMDALLMERLRNPDDVVGFVFGVASLIDNASDDVKDKAQRCCEMLLRRAFESKDGSQVTNAILEHLGIIKSENKLKKPSISAVLSMLSVAVTKDWFPAKSRSLLGFVLKQRKERVNADEAALTELFKGLSM